MWEGSARKRENPDSLRGSLSDSSWQGSTLGLSKTHLTMSPMTVIKLQETTNYRRNSPFQKQQWTARIAEEPATTEKIWRMWLYRDMPTWTVWLRRQGGLRLNSERKKGATMAILLKNLNIIWIKAGCGKEAKARCWNNLRSWIYAAEDPLSPTTGVSESRIFVVTVNISALDEHLTE